MRSAFDMAGNLAGELDALSARRDDFSVVICPYLRVIAIETGRTSAVGANVEDCWV